MNTILLICSSTHRRAPPRPGTTEIGYHRGFSLLELMIVIVIVSILLAIAIPSYTDQVRKARRSEAIEALLKVGTAQERFLFTFGRYTANLTQGRGGSPTASGLGLPATTSEGAGDNAWYNISVTVNAGGLGYVATALPQGDQADDACGQFQLTHTGERIANQPQCW